MHRSARTLTDRIVQLSKKAFGGEPAHVGDGKRQFPWIIVFTAAVYRQALVLQGTIVAKVLSWAGGSSLTSVSIVTTAWWGPFCSGALNVSFTWCTGRALGSSSTGSRAPWLAESFVIENG